MFGRRKKKYIKDFDHLSVKVPGADKASLQKVSDQGSSSNANKNSKYRNQKSKNNNSSKLEELMYEDSILIQTENSPLDKKAIPSEIQKKIKGFSQKPASRVLNLIALALVFKLGSFLMNADSLKVNSTIYIFILFVPFVIGTVIIYTAIFHTWKNKVSPAARIVARKIFRYWYLILLLLYLIYVKNAFDQLL